MFKATREIYEALKQHDGLKVFTEDSGSHSDVWLQFSSDTGANYRIRFISTSDNYDVAVRVFQLAKATEASRGKILEALNELNSKYRFVCFVLDKDNDINVEYDITRDGSNPAASALELIIRISQIIKDAYPVIMHALWA